MSVCIIGAGPAGLYTAKHLVANKIKTTIFEKLSHPFGLFKCGFSPYQNYKPTYFSSIIKNDNLLLKLNQNVKDLKNIEKKYDAFVIATGCGEPKNLQIPGCEHLIQAIDIIKNNNGCGNRLHDIGKKVLIIGCGNVSMDLIRLLFDKKVREITVLSRSSPAQSSYTNAALREVYNIPNLMITNNKIIENSENLDNLERRKKILEKPKIGSRLLSFLYLAFPLKIEKLESSYAVTINLEGKFIKKSFDTVISAIGFTKNESVKSETISKPVFNVGWCKIPTGNLADIKHDAEKTANKIIQLIKTRKGYN